MKFSKFAKIFLLSFLSMEAEATNVLLNWDSSVSPEIVGYKLYVGQQPLAYTTVFDIGNTLQKTLENVIPGTYYYAVKGYTLNDEFETAFSNEQSAVISVGVATFTVKSMLPKTLYQVIVGTTKDSNITKWQWKTTGAIINTFSKKDFSQVVFWYRLPGTYNITLNKYVGETIVETSTTPVEIK